MAHSEMRSRFLLLVALLPAAAFAQSAGEVERCFQTPGSCSSSGAAPAPVAPAPPAAAPRVAAPAPDYATVLNSPEADRRKLQESLRTLDKYNGPIDGNMQSEATVKAIGDWQKGHNAPVTGKLTPPEAVALNNEAARTPIKRIDPSSQAAATPPSPPPPPTQSNADALKALQARLAERRKTAEPKAEAAAKSLIGDLKAYVAADGKGVAGEQFAGFAKWYADNKAAGRAVGEIAPVIDDYGDAKVGAGVASEVLLESKKDASSQSQCLVFVWIEGNPRKNSQVFSCDDVAGVEKWKTDQALRSAWR
jgi:Putative peptidoglycan binding domain